MGPLSRAALEARGGMKVIDFVRVNPNTHAWFVDPRHGWGQCAVCGVIRRADRQNKPCKGPVRVGPR